MSLTASQWNPNVAAPDMSNLMQLAARAGRNTAFADFSADMLRYQQKQLDAKAKAEKKAAEQDLGNEPASEGFWHRLGDTALNGLEKTMDFLASVNYGVANAANYSVNTKDKNETWSGLGGAFWQGLTHKEHTTFADVIANAAARDGEKNFWDNNTVQGIAGFAGDVFLDPTTYVGVGLVTKPFRAAKAAEDLSKLGKSVESVDSSLVNDIMDLGLTKKGEDGVDVPLQEFEVRALLGHHMNNTIKGGKHKAALARERIQGLAKLKEKVADAGYKLPDKPKVDATKQVDELIHSTQAKYQAALNKYGQSAYKSALKEYDRKGLGDNVEATLKNADHFSEVVDTYRLARAVRAKRMGDHAALNKELHGWWGSPALSKEFKATLHSNAEDIVRGTPVGPKGRRIGGDPVYKQLGRKLFSINQDITAKKDVMKGLHGGDLKNAKDELATLYKKRDRVNEQRDLIVGNVMKNLIRHELDQIPLEGSVKGEWDKLSRRKKDIERILNDPSGLAHAAPSNAGVEGTVAAGNLQVTDEVTSLERELKDVNSRMTEIMNDHFGQGETVSKGTPEWDQTVQRMIDDRTEKEVQSMIETKLARGREGTDVPQEIKGMFGGKNGREPVIHIDGKEIAKSDKKALAKHVTEKDRQLAEEYTNAFANSEIRNMAPAETRSIELTKTVQKGNRKIKTHVGSFNVTKHVGYIEVEGGAKKLAELRTLTPSNVVIEGDNILISTEAAIKFAPEHVAFDRMFRKKNKMRLSDALNKRDHLEGNTIDMHGKPRTKQEAVDLAWKAFDEVPTVGTQSIGRISRANLGIKISVDGEHGLQYQKYQALYGPEAAQKWDEDFIKWMSETPFDKVNAEIRGAYTSRLKQLRNTHQQPRSTAKTKVRIDENAIRQKAHAKAEADILKEIEGKDSLKDVNGVTGSVDVPVGFGPDGTMTLEELHKANIQVEADRYAQQVARAKMENPRGNSNAGKLKAELENLRKTRDERIKAAEEAYKEAKATQTNMIDRIDEQMTLDSIDSLGRGEKKYLKVSFAGLTSDKLDIPLPQALTKATEAMAGIKIIQAGNKVWSEAFKPASKLEPELNQARILAQSRTPDIIKKNVDDIRHAFQNLSLSDRKTALKAYMKGAPVGDNAAYDRVAEFFDNYAVYFNGGLKVGDEPLTAFDVNAKLPDEFKIYHPKGRNVNELPLQDGRSILKYMRNLKEDTDPAKVLFNIAIAGEQAASQKALHYTIKKLFGVERKLDKGPKPKALTEEQKLIESLNKEHGWVVVPRLGNDHYFAPEMADQINTMLDMMKPVNVSKIMRVYDKMMRAWKSTVTVYNPGYYTRNGIGETMMGMFDGLYNPAFYEKAGQILRYAQPDDVKETLKSLEPWKKHATKEQLGSKYITKKKFRIEDKDGKVSYRRLTAEDIWVLYHQVGLKSGFISTEYEHYFPTLGSMKSSLPGQVATKINDKVRSAGEKYEDYFRLAHFIYRLEHAPKGSVGAKDVLLAAEESAKRVRKYHFDYTDFTPFEKTVMLRVFPFYKWTRKAVPVMAGMLFTKPGAVMLYPKAMQNLSYATGGTDPLKDDNGFYPNYQKVVPEWMRDMVSYPIGKDQQGAMDYMNVATPQLDIYKMLQDPTSATIGMLNPLIKVPLEEMAGTTLDPGFQMDLKTGEDRKNHLLRQTPITSLMSKIAKGSAKGEDSAVSEPGAPMDEVLASFLTGLGFYENNKKRQKGEQYRKFLEQTGQN